MTTTDFKIDVPPRRLPSARLVTAKSHFIDRFTPDCEIIELPARDMVSGHIEITEGEITATPPDTGRHPLKKIRALKTETAPDDRWIIDLRHNIPENWAHFLNNHLPLFFLAAETTGRDPARALILLPTSIPGYIRAAAALFGLTTHLSDATVRGEGVAALPRPLTTLRAGRADWARAPLPTAALEAGLARENPAPTPRRVFLSRQDTRCIANAPEIEAWLQARGFQTVFAETLSPAGQFRLFRDADIMVAVHGAALAPLLYRQGGQGPKKLIEIMPVGHMTDVFRAIAVQVGCDWIGVRGRMKPEYVKGGYDFSQPFKTYSLDNFEVDLVSLERAFEMMGVT